MKKLIIFIVIIILIVIYNIKNHIKNKDSKDYVTNKEMFIFGDKQYKKRNLILMGIGHSGLKIPNKFHKLSMTFYTYEDLTVFTGRKLLIDLTNDFLEQINNKKELERFLPFPFKFENVHLMLVIKDSILGFKYYPEGPTSDKNVTTILLQDGLITYFVNITKEGKYKILLEETYEEALKNLEKESSEQL